MILSSIAKLIDLSVIFIWVFGSSLGLPGGLVAMISSGALANSFLDVVWIMLAAVLGGIIGDITAYELARRFSFIASAKLKNFKFFLNNEKKAREQLKRHEFSFVFFTRFALTQLCAVVSYISGFERLNRKKFISAVVSGEILYAIIYPLIGFIFKNTWSDLIRVIQNLIIIIILIVIVVLLTIYIIKRRRKILKPTA